MAHHSRICKVVLDVPVDAHAAEVAFWQAATGQEMAPIDGAPEYSGTALRSPRMWLFVQRLADGGASRAHLDIHTDDLEAEVARLERHGATRVRRVYSWWVLRDPAGLVFCVIPTAPGSLDETNSRRWE